MTRYLLLLFLLAWQAKGQYRIDRANESASVATTYLCRQCRAGVYEMNLELDQNYEQKHLCVNSGAGQVQARVSWYDPTSGNWRNEDVSLLLGVDRFNSLNSDSWFLRTDGKHAITVSTSLTACQVGTPLYNLHVEAKPVCKRLNSVR